MSDIKLTDRYEVLTSNGFKQFYGIKKTRKETYKIVFNDNTDIICSYEHKFFENNEYIRAYDLKIGDILSNKTIVSIEKNGEQDLYDLLEVEDGHHYTANDIEVSNCAFIPKNVWENFYSSTFPTISSGKKSKLIMVSTPKGPNHFYDFWKDAIDGKNDMFPQEVNWYDVPGRDEKWRKEMLKQMSEEQFNVEYGNSFDASTNTLISPDNFAKLKREIKDPEQATKTLKIYDLPQKNRLYMATCDCASVGIDFSTISIIDITEFPYKQVAVYADNKISHLSFPQVIFQLCTKYNNAEVLVESNDIGNTILHILNFDLEYDNIVKTYRGDKQTPLLGQRTTSKTKSIGCARFKDMVESKSIVIQDSATLNEIRHFVLYGSSWVAEQGFHDDLVMGLVNFAYYATTPQFKMKYDKAFQDEYREEYDKEIIEGLTPIPLFSGNNYGDNEDTSWLK